MIFRQSVLVALVSLLTLTACDTGFQKMEAGEYGVVFGSLPPSMGGGMRDKLLAPGEMEFLFPWQKLYRLRTTRLTIGWGGSAEGGMGAHDDFVETRTQDGNEVGLAVTVDYRIDPERIGYIIQKVGTTEDRIRELVSMVARSDIRTHMNSLHTQDFFSPEKRQDAVSRVKLALQARLQPEGIFVEEVMYRGHRFERRLPDGKIDASYQEKIDNTQRNNQETLQEEKKIATEEEKKRLEFNDAQARVNRILEIAEGNKRQAALRGDAHLTTQQNVAEQVTAAGQAEVEGLRKQIEALGGPGGRALLRLQLVRELLQANPKFFVLNSSSAKGGIDLNRVDTNELLRQAGVFATAAEIAREEKKPDTATPASVPPSR